VRDEALTVNVAAGEPPRLRIVGELDLRTTRTVTAAAYSLGSHDLVIDCSGLTFLDSHGVSALVRLYRDRQAIGARRVLTGLTGSPRRVLEMMALLDMFELEP
jgi:anti-sigma B factor antagonist